MSLCRITIKKTENDILIDRVLTSDEMSLNGILISNIEKRRSAQNKPTTDLEEDILINRVLTSY
jgi:hypothetical protein